MKGHEPKTTVDDGSFQNFGSAVFEHFELFFLIMGRLEMRLFLVGVGGVGLDILVK